MGAIGGLLGLGGGANGSGFAGPQQATGAVNPTNADQLSTAYTGTQNTLASQQALLQALQSQNGLSNQNQVYNQFQGIANGTGPNPAQAMLNQSTGQNVAQQAALIAGQRGIGQNVGLAARQIAQQGAGIQQNAAGQAATLQANQSLNAINSAGNIANSQVANQVGQTNANAQAQQAQQGQLLNAQAQFNNNQVGMQSNINNINGQLANTNMQGQQALIGGLLNGGGAASALADGGDIGFPDTSTPTFSGDAGASALSGGSGGGGGGGGLMKLLPLLAAAPGGEIMPAAPSAFGPQSMFGQFLVGGSPQVDSPNISTPAFGPDSGAKALQQGTSTATHKKPDDDAPDMARGGMAGDYRSGGKVKAKNTKQKAVAPGNNYANDKIPAVLSEHEIVLPRSVTLSPDPVNSAARFVAAVMAKRKAGMR